MRQDTAEDEPTERPVAGPGPWRPRGRVKWVRQRGRCRLQAISQGRDVIMTLTRIDHECDESSVAQPKLEHAAPPRP
jgi:hypothetical protein